MFRYYPFFVIFVVRAVVLFFLGIIFVWNEDYPLEQIFDFFWFFSFFFYLVFFFNAGEWQPWNESAMDEQDLWLENAYADDNDDGDNEDDEDGEGLAAIFLEDLEKEEVVSNEKDVIWWFEDDDVEYVNADFELGFKDANFFASLEEKLFFENNDTNEEMYYEYLSFPGIEDEWIVNRTESSVEVNFDVDCV
jgi:energy-coupling factor transporter transmembrane protein EcfT